MLKNKLDMSNWADLMLNNNGKIPKNYTDIIGTCCGIFKENKKELLKLFRVENEIYFIKKYGIRIVISISNLDKQSRGSSKKFRKIIQNNKIYGPFEDHLGIHLSFNEELTDKIQNFVINEIDVCFGFNLLEFNNVNVKNQIVEWIIFNWN